MLLMRSCDLIPKDPLELKRLLSRFLLSVHALAPCQVKRPQSAEARMLAQLILAAGCPRLGLRYWMQ